MTDINLPIVIPDAHVTTIKNAAEHHAKSQGKLPRDGSFTNAQARDYILTYLRSQILDMVRVYKADTKRANADLEADNETKQIVLG